MIILLTLMACLVIAVLAARPELMPASLAETLGLAATETPPVELPTRAAAVGVPTATNTSAAPVAGGGELQPTFTPVVEVTQPLAPLPTLAPTLTPSSTPFLPSRTPRPTNTPTATFTPIGTATFTPSPTNTRSPFPFTKTVDTPRYTEQRFYDVGCSWLGFAGQVFDTGGRPVGTGYRVHVFSEGAAGIDTYGIVGDAPIYGAAGWERFVNDEPFVWTYFLQLERVDGTPVSPVYQVTTRASCRENLVIVNFVQNY
jgi:hypothetical protein